jgi:hypothetical protein
LPELWRRFGSPVKSRAKHRVVQVAPRELPVGFYAKVFEINPVPNQAHVLTIRASADGAISC